MPFVVKDFAAYIARNGIARSSFFECDVVKSPVADKFAALGGTQRGLSFRIESANLPGRNLMTFDQNYHGPTRAMVFRQSYQNCTMTVILSEDMREREFFMQWQDYAIGHSRGDRMGGRWANMFDSGYYDDYVGTVVIKQFSYGNPAQGQARTTETPPTPENSNEFLKYGVILEEAFPISVNDISMSWADDGYARLQVEMRYWYTRELHGYSNQSAVDRQKGEIFIS